MAETRTGLLDRRGVTVVELMITIGILAILFAIGYPAFRRTVQEARANEARTNLMTMYDAEYRYRVQNGRFWDNNNAGATTVPNINAALGTDLPVPVAPELPYYTYSVTGTNTTFTITATPITANGARPNRTYSINQTGALTTTGIG